MKKTFLGFALLLTTLVALYSQQVNIRPGWEVGMTVLSTTPTSVQPRTAHITAMTLVNNTASTSATVTLTDNSTNCGGSGCTLFTSTINGGQTFIIDMKGIRANSGFVWSATAANTVQGWISGQ